MKNKKFKLLIVLLALCSGLANAQATSPNSTAMQWWKDGKFGLFLHWGLYSQTAGYWKGQKARANEHFMLGEKIPLKEYATIANDFNPVKFNAEEWVKSAKNAGMKYIVITAKHHDGFSMYDSPSQPYNIVKTSPWGKDPMKDLAVACKKYNLKLCFYYSLGRDWQDPDVPTRDGYRSNTWDYPNEEMKDFAKYFERKVKPQIRELLTQYGPIGLLWFDTPEQISKAQSTALREMIKSIQPNCIINDRIGNGMGDYSVAEQKIEDKTVIKPWEACVTMSAKWGYVKYDTVWKSPELLVRQLVEVVCKGGNFLLNVAPKGDGNFPAEATDRLKALGNWMRINHDAIYGVSPFKILNEGAQSEVGRADAMGKSDNDFTSKNTRPDAYFAKKGKVIYAYARSWKMKQLNLKSLTKAIASIKSVSMLGSGEKIKWVQSSQGLNIELPNKLPSGLPVYVFEIGI
ncbi:alpha-L-fucosidase [Pedobacter sp. MC2016-05]|uniref:alpha-L-fucosidase n=1 Tax=Pedobacter sp. MC2016-05 TaxID=2994474 RepID=UPI002246AC2A|nr:alpha-L-fucosidase [Pedobacter sp. MC2016-05]MCX2477014.1 alpha-L-fucosidase [Pedobacter sp. MC2016-05]